jgi:ABC-type Fe3+-hydroxamate transport system substrate-binding protein
LNTSHALNRLQTFAAVAILAGCAPAAAPPAHPHGTRIVSLVPSLTEDLCAIGARGELVAVSNFTEKIACANGLPRVATFANVDAERIVALHPSVVVAIPAQRFETQPLRRAGIPVVYLPDDSFSDVFLDIERLGTIGGRPSQARALTASLRARTRQLRAGEHFRRRPRVFVALGAGPIWTAGPQSYLSTLIAFAGGENAVRNLSSAYGTYSPEALLALDPDVIVTERGTGVPSALSREPWKSLTAVKRGRVYAIDDPDVLYRPGPRYNLGLQWLIERLKPLAT